MAQLSDDCFAATDATLSIEDALARFAARVSPVAGVETVDLAAADGRVLAEAVEARVALPPFANAAVDGFAVRFADIAAAGETRLAVVDRLQAGMAARRGLEAGEAIRLFTGAPVPEGADTIYMQEDARVEGATVVVPAGLKRGSNLRPAGEELMAGHRVLPAGRRLRPQDLALAAGVGVARLTVRRRLKVALFSTGDELVEPGAARRDAQVFDTNRVMIAGLLARLGCAVTDLGILADDLPSLTAALDAAASSHDLVLTSGGVSTGEADHVKTAIAAIGRLDVWRFAIKPGRPLALGSIRGAAFVGLPGNPVAVFVTFTQIVRGLIAALSGESWRRPRPFAVTSGFDHAKKSGRTEFLRVRLTADAEGRLVADRFVPEGAGIISSLTDTEGLVELPADAKGVAAGDRLAFVPFDRMI